MLQANRVTRYVVVVLLLGVVALSEGTAMAEGSGTAVSTLHAGPGSRLWLEGDSTLHRYKADATQFRASFDVDAGGGPAELETLVRSGRVKGLVLNVPVAQLRSGKSDLDENMVQALKGKEHPSITFRLDSYTVTPGKGGGPGFTIKLRGKLLIAGALRDTELEAAATRVGDGLVLTGRKQLLMSDFGVKPPVLMLGMLKTRNEVDVAFELVLKGGPAVVADAK